MKDLINGNLEVFKGYGKEISLKDLIQMINADNKSKLFLNKIATFCNIADINVYKYCIFFGPEINKMLNNLKSKLQNNYNNNLFLK